MHILLLYIDFVYVIVYILYPETTHTHTHIIMHISLLCIYFVYIIVYILYPETTSNLSSKTQRSRAVSHKTPRNHKQNVWLPVYLRLSSAFRSFRSCREIPFPPPPPTAGDEPSLSVLLLGERSPELSNISVDGRATCGRSCR